MKISVFGLGYVGTVACGCLARDGFSVTGVDLNTEKTAMVAAGQSPIMELGLSELLREAVESGRLKTTTDGRAAVQQTDVSLICVGTPSQADGTADLRAVYRVVDEIGLAIAAKKAAHVVVLRSTVTPGTTTRCEARLRQLAGGVSVHVAFNPEFLREGEALRDYDEPPFTIIGTTDPVAERVVRALYASVDAPVLVLEPALAEMVKLAANAWHATKIAFANEIGRLAKALGVDGRQLMDVLCRDTKLNVSSQYLRPGFAYGGSCLPKDTRALAALGRARGVAMPLLEALPVSNAAHIELAMQLIRATGRRRIGMLGLAFKAGSDDLRESPSVDLAARLLREGYMVRVLDHTVREARLMGANRAYIDQRLPQWPTLLVGSATELLSQVDALVITHNLAEFRQVVLQAAPDTPILDLAGLAFLELEGRRYEGIAWPGIDHR